MLIGEEICLILYKKFTSAPPPPEFKYGLINWPGWAVTVTRINNKISILYDHDLMILILWHLNPVICVGWEDLSTFFFWEIPPVFLSTGESVSATNKQVLSRKNCAILICSRGQKWICQRDKLGFPNATCLSFPLTQNKYFLPVWFTRIICSKFYLTSDGICMVLSATTLLRFATLVTSNTRVFSTPSWIGGRCDLKKNV